MSILLIEKTKNSTLSTSFTSSSFNCPCSDCKVTHIDTELVSGLEAMKTLIGSKLHITSAYRCESYQEQLRIRGYETSKKISQHTLGKAADITDGVTTGLELEEFARRAGFTSVGVGKNWVHVDLRSGYRRWEYVKR